MLTGSARNAEGKQMTTAPAPLKIGIRVPPTRPITEIAKVAQRAEEVGFDIVAIPDSPTIERDTFATLSVIAIETQNVALMSYVTNVVTRSPVVVASATRTIAEIAPGRFRLGLGVGDSAANLTGNQPAGTKTLREGVRIVTELLAGREIQVGPQHVILADPPSEHVPLYLGANGPRNLALAAEVADGVMTNHRGIERAFELVDGVIAENHREQPLQRATGAFMCITDDLEREARQMKPKIANHIRRDGNAMLEEAGFSVSVPTGHIPLADGSDLGHPRDWAAAVEVASQWISDELAIWYAQNIYFFGTGAEIADRLLELSAIGLDEVICANPYALTVPEQLIEDVASEVIPRVHAAQRAAS